jgi:glycosyltransferase involved in cell wall biosynthesis
MTSEANKKKEKSRVLILENSQDVTGALNSIYRSCEGLKSIFHFVFILPSGSKASSFIRQQGYDVYELPMRELRKSIASLILYIPFLIMNTFRLHALIRKQRIDLIHNNDFYNLLPSVYKFTGGKAPYVCHVRFLPEKFPSILVKLWCSLHAKFASSIIAVSQAVKKQIKDYNNVVVIGNELPTAELRDFRYSTSTLILYPANYIMGKGHDAALDSFASICKKYPSWKLRFMGGDMGLQKNRDFRNSLIKHAKALGVSNQIEWAGFSHAMDRAYQDAAIVLNFSESESFSMTCLEALYYGRPVIATDSGGPSEIIDDNKTGILVPVGDLRAMSGALERLIMDPLQRESLASEGFRVARERFSYRNTIAKLGEIYAYVLVDKNSNF